jgi:phosphoglucosamine mutase
MRDLFGTDGIRGVAGEFPLDSPTIGCIGLAVGRQLKDMVQTPRVILGRDTRESGESIGSRLISSLRAAGIEMIHEVGVISTPGLAFLTRAHAFDLGIMISASHNPYQDNGIKLFSRDGFKFPDEWERRIEEKIHLLIRKGAHGPALYGENSYHSEAETSDYIRFLVSQFRGKYAAGRVGLDLCNGSAYRIAPEVFRRIGAEVHVINDTPDGQNINRNCGSLHINQLANLVMQSNLDFGVAFDGDADRALFVTHSGRIFDGDYVLYAFSDYYRRGGSLQRDTVVGTVMTNLALEKSLKKQGITLIRAAVGDKYVLEEMRKTGANLGGEPSGHIILSDCHTTGDGILTAIKLSEILSVEHLPLDELAKGFHPYPQILDGLRVKSKVPLTSSEEIRELIGEAQRALEDDGRLVVRYSGTEPLLRIMAEGKDLEQVQRLVHRLKTGLQQFFSALPD